jgi:hypothetical protein
MCCVAHLAGIISWGFFHHAVIWFIKLANVEIYIVLGLIVRIMGKDGEYGRQ